MSSVTKPYTFTPGNQIEANKVNKNLDEIYNKVNGNINSDNLSADAVETSNIAGSAITEAKLATDAVTTTKIKDSNVTSAKLNLTKTTVDTTWTEIDFNSFKMYITQIAVTLATGVTTQDVSLTNTNINTVDLGSDSVIVQVTPMFHFNAGYDYLDVNSGINADSVNYQIDTGTNDIDTVLSGAYLEVTIIDNR